MALTIETYRPSLRLSEPTYLPWSPFIEHIWNPFSKPKNALSVVQTKSETVANVGNRTLTFDSAVTSGNLLVMCVQGWHGTPPFAVGTGPSDTGGNIWAETITSDAAGSARCAIWHTFNCTGGSSFQVTLDVAASASYYTWAIIEVSGATTTDPVDKTAKSTGTGTTINSGTTAAVAQNDEIVFSVCSLNSNINPDTLTVESVSPSWTQIIENIDGVNGQVGEIDYRIITGGGTQTCNWACSNFSWTSCIATFKAATTPTNPDILFLRR